jgi:DNA adenine methylase
MKYLGGKQRLGKHLAPVLKELWNYVLNASETPLDGYMEPFCGSLGVFRNMTNLTTDKFIANDYHPDLIQMWNEVKNETFVYPESVSEEEYLEAKKLTSPNAVKAFIGFGMSFGGRFFGAYAHKYMNDKKEDFCKEMMHSLKRATPLIKNVEFTNKSYLDLNPVNMFIYCDPPYKYSKFPIKYRRDVKKYDVFDNDLFWKTVRKWSENNLVVVSEMDAPEDFVEIWNFERYRSAAQSKKTRFKPDLPNEKSSSETNKTEKLFIYSKSALPWKKIH